MTMHVDSFEEGEWERGPWLEILEVEGERKPWEITWHIWLQVAVASSKLEEGRCQRVLGMPKGEIVGRAISQANAVLEEHGALGTAALSAAEDSLEALRGTEWFGLVKIAATTKIEEGL